MLSLKVRDKDIGWEFRSKEGSQMRAEKWNEVTGFIIKLYYKQSTKGGALLLFLLFLFMFWFVFKGMMHLWENNVIQILWARTPRLKVVSSFHMPSRYRSGLLFKVESKNLTSLFIISGNMSKSSEQLQPFESVDFSVIKCDF